MKNGEGKQAKGGYGSVGMVIPYELLSEAALRGIVEEFVLREGTEYGRREYSLDEKCRTVLEQLKKKRAKIVFDSKEGTCNILQADESLVPEKPSK